MAINAEWHLAHRMPPKATFAQRVAWHSEHELNCQCRKVPDSLRDAIDAYRASEQTKEQDQ